MYSLGAFQCDGTANRVPYIVGNQPLEVLAFLTDRIRELRSRASSYGFAMEIGVPDPYRLSKPAIRAPMMRRSREIALCSLREQILVSIAVADNVRDLFAVAVTTNAPRVHRLNAGS